MDSKLIKQFINDEIYVIAISTNRVKATTITENKLTKTENTQDAKPIVESVNIENIEYVTKNDVDTENTQISEPTNQSIETKDTQSSEPTNNDTNIDSIDEDDKKGLIKPHKTFALNYTFSELMNANYSKYWNKEGGYIEPYFVFPSTQIIIKNSKGDESKLFRTVEEYSKFLNEQRETDIITTADIAGQTLNNPEHYYNPDYMYLRFYEFGTCSREIDNPNWECIWNNINVDGWSIRQFETLSEFGYVITIDELLSQIRSYVNNSFESKDLIAKIENEYSDEITRIENEYSNQINKIQKQHNDYVQQIIKQSEIDAKSIKQRLESNVEEYKQLLQATIKGHKKELKTKMKLIENMKAMLSDKNDEIEELEQEILKYQPYSNQIKTLRIEKVELIDENRHLNEQLKKTIKIYDFVVILLLMVVICFAVLEVTFH